MRLYRCTSRSCTLLSPIHSKISWAASCKTTWVTLAWHDWSNTVEDGSNSLQVATWIGSRISGWTVHFVVRQIISLPSSIYRQQTTVVPSAKLSTYGHRPTSSFRILSVNWRHIHWPIVSAKWKTKKVYCCDIVVLILMFLMREGLQCRISILKHCLMRLWIDINQLTFVFPFAETRSIKRMWPSVAKIWNSFLIRVRTSQCSIQGLMARGQGLGLERSNDKDKDL